MDPVTHAVLGAAVAQSFFPAREGRRALVLGAAAGVLADADVLMRLVSDPALPWEVHRHVTHALAAAPAGGLIAALPFLAWRWWRQRWKATLAAATLAYATHGVLDACTTYGTHLLLPFSQARIAWDIISIVDPLFTLVLLAGVLWSALRLRAAPAVLALVLCAAYLGLGARQHAAAMDGLMKTAAARGHTVARARAMPTPANLVLWRGLYLADGRIHAVRGWVPFLGSPRWQPGGSIEQFVPDLHGRSGAVSPRDARIADVEARFVRFTDGFAARDPERPDVLADMRYSLEVASFSPLWGIRLNPAPVEDPVSWVSLVTDRRASLIKMWSDLRSP